MYDFTSFESHIFPEFINQFRIKSSAHHFSWKPRGNLSLYATADMIYSHWILGDDQFLNTLKEPLSEVIHQFQNKSTGWYTKRYGKRHFKEHTCAYAVGALFLLDKYPKYPFSFLDSIISSQKNTEKWLRQNNWTIIWLGSHAISGIPAILAMSQGKDLPFFKWYFNWLDEHVNPKTGFWELGIHHKLKILKNPTIHEMAGAFHMFYIYTHLNRSWKYPKQVIDHTLRLQNKTGLWSNDVPFGVDMDGLYCLLESNRQLNGYRQEEINHAVYTYLEKVQNLLNNKQYVLKNYQNTHKIVGTLNAIALCQKYYPKIVKTQNKWRFSLDKACYI